MKRLVRNELSVTEIAEPYNMSLAAISKHLKVLERANLLHRRRNGKMYMLNANIEPLKQVDNWIDFYRKYWEGAFDKMDEYLTELQKGEKKNDSETS